MFRPMRRFKQQLSREECIAILKSEVRGVLSVLGDDDYPYGIPLDFYYSEADGRIYFHGAGEGHKIDSIKRHDKVSFCVMDKGTPDAEGWFLHFKSVIVFGRIRIVEDHDKALDICRKLCYKFNFAPEFIEKTIEKSGPKVTCLELVPEHITGKVIKEK
ncbi:MAG: pyridoxamine 5'-phosphate oxidase family protein [Spirochaetia bacterium]|nr:pyridoxamine 5'-phosphate oxidase family protein [Spirochaetia bacterium]MBR4797186.1 pyridoxamine 5'-phosphate oxidase family protein [Spirochaetia bacterium]